MSDEYARTPTGKFGAGNKGGGRPPGSRNITTLMAESIIGEKAESIINKVVDLALEGDMSALKLCVERILPSKKDRASSFNIGEITDISQEASKVMELTNALMNGEIGESQAMAASHLLAHARKSFELKEITEKLNRVCEHVGID